MIFKITQLKEVNPSLAVQLRNYVYDVQGACQEVHAEMGPFLNEYMYQDALAILLREKDIEFEKEYYFSVSFHQQVIKHKHYVDFFCKHNIFVECKAVESLCKEHRQQLWNYMRLTGNRIGLLYNFAPPRDECERYYYDSEKGHMYMF
ncbi:MAG: GxxExxY protein [Bacteroidaceae bacterium]|nr:GxxExxY protein [Bacteroidaceae bacterium]